MPSSGSTRFRVFAARLAFGWLPPVVGPALFNRSKILTEDRAGDSPRNFAVRAGTGSVLVTNSGDEHGRLFSVFGFYDWRLTTIAKALVKPGDVVVEIGANVGTETIAFSDLVGERGEVVAFEPLPSNLATLERSLAKKRYQNVKLLPFAASDREAKLFFRPPPSAFASGSGSIIEDGHPDAIEVQAVTIDSQLLGTKAALLVIDVEGHENSVLRGAEQFLKRHRPAIICEARADTLESAGSSLAELAKTLSDQGYDLWRIGRMRLSAIPLDRLSANERPGNWLCTPREHPDLARRADTALWRTSLSPRFFWYLRQVTGGW